MTCNQARWQPAALFLVLAACSVSSVVQAGALRKNLLETKEAAGHDDLTGSGTSTEGEGEEFDVDGAGDRYAHLPAPTVVADADPRTQMLGGITPALAWSAETRTMYTVPARPTGGTNGPFPVAPCKDGRPPVHECKTGTGSDCCLNGSPPPPSRTTDTDRLQREGPSLGQEPVFGGAVGGWGPAIGTTATEITKEVDYGDGVKLSFHVQCPDVNDHSKGFVTVSRVSTTPEEARPWTFRFPDYKGRPIRVPDVKLVGWWKSRVVSAWAIEREDGGRGDPEAAESVQNTVVYGTKTDRYAEMPEKHGTLSRRSVPDRMPEEKKEDYQRRLDENNPLRKLPKPKNPIKKAIHQIKVKGTSTKFLGVSKTEEEVQDRWNEIFEVSRQRVKHSHHGATQFVMLNSFLNTAEEFVRMYMVGSQGSDGVQHPTALNSEHEEIEGSGHVTDHELYSIFAGKHRKDILDRALFGNRETEVTDPDKVSRTGNPFLAMVTRKKFKNQIARKWHIVNN